MDDAGAPVTNIQIFADAPPDGSTQSTTDTNGNFVLNVNAGVWSLRFDSSAVAARGLIASFLNVTVTNGVDQNGINLVLPRATAQISGSVKTGKGAAIDNTLVTAAATINGTNYNTVNATDAAGN